MLLFLSHILGTKGLKDYASLRKIKGCCTDRLLPYFDGDLIKGMSHIYMMPNMLYLYRMVFMRVARHDIVLVLGLLVGLFGARSVLSGVGWRRLAWHGIDRLIYLKHM